MFLGVCFFVFQKEERGRQKDEVMLMASGTKRKGKFNWKGANHVSIISRACAMRFGSSKGLD